MTSQTSELVELKFHEAIEKLQALRRMCEASGQPFYVEILDETIPVFAREYNAQINERLSSSEVTEEEVEDVAGEIACRVYEYGPHEDSRTIARAAITAMRSAATSERKG